MVRWLMLVLVVVLACPAMAAEELVKAQLLVDSARVSSGQRFEVGVLLRVAKGWHIYWKNPGDAGVATVVRWNLPAGTTVSDLYWPVPKEFIQPGEIAGFGYEDEVVLISTITPPPGHRGPLPIQADVQWLACKETCVPGRARLERVVQVEKGRGEGEVTKGNAPEASTNSELLAQWRRRLPEEGIQARVRREGLSYRVELPATGVTSPQVFVAPPDEYEVKARSAWATPSEVTAEITLSRLAGEKPGGTPAEVVLVWQDEKHQQRSGRILLPGP